MILGSKSRYAVMAMVELAQRQSDKPITLAEIAQSQEIPLAYLEQIFVHLKRAKLVSSVRGPGGGYVLGKEAEFISIAAIISATEEPIKMTRCDKQSHEGCTTSKARCATHALWEGLENQIYQYLNSISLGEMKAKKFAPMLMQLGQCGQPASPLNIQ